MEIAVLSTMKKKERNGKRKNRKEKHTEIREKVWWIMLIAKNMMKIEKDMKLIWILTLI